jgi:hypothetical protein
MIVFSKRPGACESKVEWPQLRMDGAAGSVAITRPFGRPLRLQCTSSTFTDARENRIVVEAVEKRWWPTIFLVAAGTHRGS